MPIPLAAWTTAWVYILSLTGIAGLNPAKKDGCLSLVRVVCVRGLRRADRTSSGIPPNVCLCMCVSVSVCVSLRLIRCNDNPNLQRVSIKRLQLERERFNIYHSDCKVIRKNTNVFFQLDILFSFFHNS